MTRPYKRGPRCSKCEVEHDRRDQRLCLKCHAENMREWRKGRPLTLDQRKKDRCHAASKYLVRVGRLTRRPCEECGSPKSEMHHPDYDDPKTVVWLCRFHHLALHRRIKYGQPFSNVSRAVSRLNIPSEQKKV